MRAVHDAHTFLGDLLCTKAKNLKAINHTADSPAVSAALSTLGIYQVILRMISVFRSISRCTVHTGTSDY